VDDDALQRPLAVAGVPANRQGDGDGHAELLAAGQVVHADRRWVVGPADAQVNALSSPSAGSSSWIVRSPPDSRWAVSLARWTISRSAARTNSRWRPALPSRPSSLPWTRRSA